MRTPTAKIIPSTRNVARATIHPTRRLEGRRVVVQERERPPRPSPLAFGPSVLGPFVASRSFQDGSSSGSAGAWTGTGITGATTGLLPLTATGRGAGAAGAAVATAGMLRTCG